uniref:Uncharacterized protein n=1 Tax=Meloidogyne enterolobii TaxID=390850 RepID=A0A6V7WIL2_MELEN|nr:unnamed protein product [Meloidogyne enterolobii]
MNFGTQQDAMSGHLYPSTEEQEQQMILRAQEESAQNAPRRSGP